MPFASGSYFIDQRYWMLEIQILSVANWGPRICLRIARRQILELERLKHDPGPRRLPRHILPRQIKVLSSIAFLKQLPIHL
jgi:hypothetical protein